MMMSTTHRLPASIRPGRALLVSLFTLLVVAGCERSGKPAALAVTDAYIRMPPPGAPIAAGYFRLENPTDQKLTLRSVSSPDFASIEMHETTIENGLSKMRQLESVSVAPGDALIFEPGGRHLMLSGSTSDLSGKKRVPLTMELDGPQGSVATVEAFFDLSGSAEDHAGHPH